MTDVTQGHTPGPWKVGKPFNDSRHGRNTSNTITPVYAEDAECNSCGRGGGEWLIAWLFRHATAQTRANARLIAAAPELLDGGHRLAMLALQSERYRDDPDYREAVDALLGIIRRAEGRD